MFDHQTDTKKHIAFMSSKIYFEQVASSPTRLNLRRTKQAQFGRLAVLHGTFAQRKHEILALFSKVSVY